MAAIHFLVAIICLLKLQNGDCARPAIVESIVDEVRPIDTTAMLNCTVALFDNKAEQVQWYKIVPGQPPKTISAGTKIQEQNPKLQGDMFKYEVRTYQGRSTFIPDMGYASLRTFTLMIRRVTNLDAATYKCRVDMPGEQQMAPEVFTRLIIPREPFINPSQVTNNQVVEEGANVTLSCVATSEPPARISWIRANGQPLNVPGRPQRIYASSFTLVNVTRHDRGVYRCHANNNVGYGATYDIRIDVNYAPGVRAARLYGLYLQAPDRNFEVTLECISSGFPDPEVSFYRGKHSPRADEQLPDSALIKNEYPFTVERLRSQGAINTDVDEFFYTMRIKDVLSDHFGNYTCVARNKYGVAGAVLSLQRDEVCQGPLCFGSGSQSLPGNAPRLRPLPPTLLLLPTAAPLLLLLRLRRL